MLIEDLKSTTCLPVYSGTLRSIPSENSGLFFGIETAMR
jgi:hypothetical protein